MHVLVTRPEPEASAMVARLAALGVDATPAPVSSVEFCAPPVLVSSAVVGAIATSRNALAALARHPDLARLVRLTLFVVGPGTATVARQMGFTNVTEGPGTASGLADTIASARPAGRLLLLRGETVAFDLRSALAMQGVSADEIVVYRMRRSERLAESAREALATGRASGIVLMSPETAKVFTLLVQGADLTRALRALTYFCLSPAVAAVAAAPATAEVLIATKPTLEEMLALIARRASQSAPKL